MRQLFTYDFNFIDIYEQLRNNAGEFQPVCYGARGGVYGIFYANPTRLIKAIKLQHVSGFITCSSRRIPSYWGCGCCYKPDTILTVITDLFNISPLFPVNKYDTKVGQNEYAIPGYNHISMELVLPAPNGIAQLVRRGWLLIWHGEDLTNYATFDNDGVHCVNVSALYV